MINTEKHGFIIKREATIDEIGATLYEMEHKKSGAMLVYFDREDENKTFSIGFPTPPSDSTGVFHIIEHSVLCGSEKYPLRDPFAELLKGSLNTFLNAMTYEDRTVYPVSSRCEKDFLNLIDVYMDATLAPNLLRNPNIFRQEGWHYEYNAESDTLSYNGVVYNEMKGAYSSPDELGAEALNRALFGGTPYGCDSGGNPKNIPDLTYEKLCATHQKHYHPSSAKIILDGKMDLDAVLSLIDSHLCRFDRCEAIKMPGEPTPVISPDTTISYEIAQNEDEHGKARILYGFVYSDFADKEAHLTASVLSDYLCGSNASPLKKALLDEGLAKDAAMYAVKSRSQTVVLEIRNADETRLDELDSKIKEIIEETIRVGMDKKSLNAILNSIEFRLRERDFGTLPTGIAFAMSIYGDWMHGSLPENSLTVEATLANVRANIADGYFESALEKIMLNNPHRAKVIMLPDKTLGQKNAEAEAERLRSILASMSDDEKARIVAEEASLREWQQTEESDEALKCLPTLELSDIRTKTERPETRVNDYNGAKILECDIKTNGIVYISMFFDASDVAKEELLVLSTLSSAMINLPTKRRDALSLQNDIKENLGSIFASFALNSRDGKTIPCFKLGASALSSKSDDVIRIISEILLESELNRPEEIKRLILQTKANLEEAMVASGESFAMSRVEASVGEVGAMTEYLSGYEAYKLMCKILEIDERVEALASAVSALLAKLCVRERLLVAVGGEGGQDLARRLVDIMPSRAEDIIKKSTPPCAQKDEYFLLPTKVAYAVAGGMSPEVKKKLGILRVARSILSYEYLWNTIRVKNGAYGAGFVPKRDGMLTFYSYRDPSPGKSLQYYKESSEYLRHIAKDGDDLTKFVIGAIGEYDMVTTPRVSFMVAVRDYMAGWTDEDEAATMEQMRGFKTEDLLVAADIIDSVLEKQSVAVIGGSEHLKSFDNEPQNIIRF